MAKNDLMPICDLMGQTFTIPHYQRGYRWEEQEVTELLDDLWAFNNDTALGDFYCLQPIVLRKNKKGNYDVLDGQQRLTTLYLILVYLEEESKRNRYLQPLFSLNYATRKECENFLSMKKFSNGDIDRSNIDFFHICNAYNYIDKWFDDEEHQGAKSRLVSILLDKTARGKRNVRVIRYEVEEGINPIEVFISLNMGKIPLTDAELTKALLLQYDKYPQREKEKKIIELKLFNIATEWDYIETTLQDEAFWGFLNDNSNEKSSHIEFIFDLLANKINAEKKYFETKPKKYATFLIFSKYLQDLIDDEVDENESRINAIKKIWGEVFEYFEYFREWFQDRTLYHYIGLLIALKGNKIIDSIIQEEKQISKPDFKEYLEQEIARIIKTKKLLKNLIYEDKDTKDTDAWAIRKILLLHNVYTTLNSKNEKPRFPFELYNNQGWSLEHIYARNSQSLTEIKKQKEWLDDHIKSLSNSNSNGSYKELIKKMEEMSAQEEIDNDIFAKIEGEFYEKIEGHFEFGNDENIHSIKNLCLLDGATNSLLNNSYFDVKREKIKRRVLEGYYIPVCTRNVFLKAYTAYPATNTYWTKTDRNDYYKDIEKTYNVFVTKLKGVTK
jgi:uncharacterized protein with ParB-like and HNH nuclease domain